MPAVPAVAPEPEPVKKEPVPAPEFGSFTVEVSTKDGDEFRGDVSLGSFAGEPHGIDGVGKSSPETMGFSDFSMTYYGFFHGFSMVFLQKLP